MRKILLICAFIGLSSFAQADIATDNTQTTWILSYAAASAYDVYWRWPGNNFVPMDPGTLVWGVAKFPQDDLSVHQQKATYVMSKMGIGLVTGTVLSFYNAQRYDRSPAWDDVVFGGLGGVTSVVIHF